MTDIANLSSNKSGRNRLDVEDHEVNLHAVTSAPISLSHVAEGLTSEQKFVALRRFNYEGLVSLEDLPIGATFLLEKLQELPLGEAIEILKEYLVEHKDDVNIPTADYELIERLVDEGPAHGVKSDIRDQLEKKEESSHDVKSVLASSLEAASQDYYQIFDWELQTRIEATLIAYHSPYPEVRSVSEPYDDPTLPVETPRAYFVGLVWVAIGVFINQFFSERQPSIQFTNSVAQLFIYPTGVLLQYILPKFKFKVWKYELDLNPGPWNYKEQMLATIFFSVGGGTSYVSWNIHNQKLDVYYGNKWVDFGYETLLVLSTNFMGFGFAGILRKFAIYPVKAIWPSILPTVALNRALTRPENKENINGWTISRYRFFFLVTAISFVYFWVPDYLFQALSTFNWITWIKPDNYNLAMITGSVGGLGLNPITTFDWNIVDFRDPLVLPFYSFVNQYIGAFLGFFTIVGVYWSNYKWSGYMPLNSNALFTNTGERYVVTNVVNEKSLFDQKKYEEYGPPFYTAANLVVYGSFFAIYPFAIVYEVFNYRQTIWNAISGLFSGFKNFRSSTYEGFTDPHSKMMSRYKEVPEWCFLVVLVIAVVLAILCVKLYPAETPVWSIFFALAINFVFLIPLTVIYATTGFSFGLNVLVELIVGYAIPGNGLALNFIKALGYNIDGQAQNYISDQKLGHYVKIPQRAMFRAQLLSVFVSSFIGLAVINFQIENFEDYCTPTQAQKFTCPSARTFFSASILWGVIGPKRVFGGLYPILQYCFLIGFLLAFPCILIKKYGPKSWVKYFQPTLIIGGFLHYAPYNLSYDTPGLYASIAFMYYLRKNYLSWWEKYNYVFAGAMKAGIAFSAIIIFFAVQYHPKDITWWGNTVMYAGQDGLGSARLNATESAPDGYFGPRIGNFP